MASQTRGVNENTEISAAAEQARVIQSIDSPDAELSDEAPLQGSCENAGRPQLNGQSLLNGSRAGENGFIETTSRRVCNFMGKLENVNALLSLTSAEEALT